MDCGVRAIAGEFEEGLAPALLLLSALERGFGVVAFVLEVLLDDGCK